MAIKDFGILLVVGADCWNIWQSYFENLNLMWVRLLIGFCLVRTKVLNEIHYSGALKRTYDRVMKRFVTARA